MTEKTIPRRQADGKIEFRSVDELLEKALKETDFAVLPDRGKPLDLKKYFASGPEYRIAHKLLKDNQVLPQSLQERKEAEQFTLAAGTYIDRERDNLAVLYSTIPQTAARVTKVFPDCRSLLDILSMDTLPAYLPEPAAAPPPSPQQLLRDALHLEQEIAAYNRHLEIVISHYIHLLEQANNRISRLYTQVACCRDLSPHLQLKPHDIETEKKDFHNTHPPLPPLPTDFPERLYNYYGGAHPSIWQRLVGIGKLRSRKWTFSRERI